MKLMAWLVFCGFMLNTSMMCQTINAIWGWQEASLRWSLLSYGSFLGMLVVIILISEAPR